MDPASLKITQKKLLGRCSHYQRKVLLIKKGNEEGKHTRLGKLEGLMDTKFSPVEKKKTT